MDWKASLAGLVAGGLIGTTGMGVGSVVTPVLVLLGVPPLQAVGSSLVHAFVIQLVAGGVHVRLGAVDYRAACSLSLGSVPAGVLAAGAITRLGDSPALLEARMAQLLGVALLAAAVVLLLQPQPGMRRTAGAEPPRRWLLAGGGTAVGALVGLTSVGSGTLPTALLGTGAYVDERRAVGTVTVHALVLTAAAGGVHLALGRVDGVLVISLLAGSIPGVLLGARASLRPPAPLIREALASVLVLLSLLTHATTEPCIGAELTTTTKEAE